MSQPIGQPEWSHEYQRHLYTHLDQHYGRYYWTHYVEGQGWVFFQWKPEQSERPRGDSVVGPWTSSAGPAGFPQGKGKGHPVYGTYNHVTDRHYEVLDASFYVRDGSFFHEGRVFAILFSEAAGANALNAVTDYNTALSKVRYDEFVHSQVRRFIVVRRKREFCYAIPIFTYKGQGTKKFGVVPNEHAIAYSYGSSPQLLPGEQMLVKTDIPIVMNSGEKDLAPASRIYFGIHHPIQFNVKVKDLGYVHTDWMATFLGYWNQENGSDTRQAADVTDEAATTGDED